MRKSYLAVPIALTAATASMLALTMITGPALAKTSAAGQQGRACVASQLSMTVPKAIAGDPAAGMGRLAWNILLRNTSKAGCSLAGWPALNVTSAGRRVAITSQDVSFSNLATVRPQALALAAGQQAVVTVQASDNTTGCPARWTLRLRLPGKAGSLAAAQPASGFGPCAGGLLRLSPFYPRSSLASAIKTLRVAHSPSAYPTSNAQPPAACTPQDMRVAASYGAAAKQGGSVEVLRLVGRNSRPCSLGGEWPTITLRSANGVTQIAKALTMLPKHVTRSPLVSYQHGRSAHTDLIISSGRTASIALVTQTTGAACHVATSATVYPGFTDLGAGLTVRLTRPVTFCGLPRVLSFLAGQPSAAAVMPAARALTLAHAGVTPDGDSPSGFWYGSDSNAPVPSSSSGGVWLMPHSPTGGNYGGYVGELGAYDVWQNCTSGVNWSQTAYNDAESNLNNHNVGVGAGGYWMMAGPGREPGGFTTSEANATSWGTSQAQRAVSDAMNQPLGFPYIFMDIEAADPHGWNEGFSSVCGSTETASSISATLDRDTFNGFWNFVENSSPYLAAVYEAGGGGGNSWSSIFGSQTLGNTLEWTYVNETSSLATFPTSFSVGGTSAVWFASAPSQCQMLWQWSGGNGQLNGVGDFDQIDSNRNFVCV